MAPDPVRDALDDLAAADAVRRLHDRDTSLWSDDPAVQATIANRLGWLDVARPPNGWLDRLQAFRENVSDSDIDGVVLCGMGGSSLAPEVLSLVLGSHTAYGLPLTVLDSTHPAAVARALEGHHDRDRLLVIVSSKSGTTEETRDFGAHAAEILRDPRRLVAITDPGSELEAQAQREGWREVFANPPDIGGRYSALSLVGMVPAALLGLDVDDLWDRAGAMAEACARTDLDRNPGAQLGAFMAAHARAGRDKLTLLAPPSLAPLGDWIEQLVAESTGKQGTGVIPIVGEAQGPPEVYGDDRAFVCLALGMQTPEGLDALTAAGHPVLPLHLDDRDDLGGEFVRWEVATALAGFLLGVNPFDEPNVAESKAATLKVLADVEAGAPLPEPEDADAASLIAEAQPGDYLAIQAFIDPTREHLEQLQRLRGAIRDRRGLAVTVGLGPRFLHSTGQLHKGGPATVVALQLVDPVVGGPSIPGRPFDFATLLRAQAHGDLVSLRAHGLRSAQRGAPGTAGLTAAVDAILDVLA